MKLPYLDAENCRRREIAALYSRTIRNPQVVLPEFAPSAEEQVWHQYVVRCAARDRFRSYLEEKGVGTGIHYPIPPHKQDCYREYRSLSLPVAERLETEVVSLPISPILSDEAVCEIAEAINSF